MPKQSSRSPPAPNSNRQNLCLGKSPFMKAYQYITLKQTEWALNHDIQLIGSKGDKGRPAYTALMKTLLIFILPN